MESLSYAFEGREPAFTDDIELQMDCFVRSRNLLKGWDIEPLPTLVTDTVDGTRILGPGLPDTTRKSVLSNQCLEISVEDTDVDSGKSAPCTSTTTLNSSAQFGRKISSSSINEKFRRTRSEMEKLGVSDGNQLSNENLGLSSPEPPVSAKRARLTNMQQQNPVCQVYGCNKDLTTSKDYHKRHKVCGIHSKTSIVIVNGIKQRFCQQCSRFHVLAEFDEDKRSCRKRLAGHNERRRKPQFDNPFGSTFSGTDLSSASMLFSEVFPGVFFGNGPTNYSRRTMNEKYAPNQSSQFAQQTKFDHSLPTSLSHPSRNCSNAPLSVKELSMGSNSSGALSLLSAQSQSSTNNSAGMSMAHPLFFEENQHRNQDFTMKGRPDILTPSAFISSGDVEGVSDANISVGFEVPRNKFVQESNSSKSFMSPEGANTVDLLQLSLHLQRVEQQKYSAQVKLENGVICHSTIS